MSNTYAAAKLPRYVILGSTPIHRIEVENEASANEIASGLRALGFIVRIEVMYDLELVNPLQITEHGTNQQSPSTETIIGQGPGPTAAQ